MIVNGHILIKFQFQHIFCYCTEFCRFFEIDRIVRHRSATCQNLSITHDLLLTLISFSVHSSSNHIGQSRQAIELPLLVLFLFYAIIFLIYRAVVAWWWEQSPPTNVARVRFPTSMSYVCWVCWFSSLLWEVFPRVLRFSPLLKNLPLIKFDLINFIWTRPHKLWALKPIVFK